MTGLKSVVSDLETRSVFRYGRHRIFTKPKI